MKKIITILLVFFSTQILFAQGIKARLLTGFNVAQVDGDKYRGYDKFGLVGGASVFIPLTKNDDWFLEEEIVYSQQGSRNGKNETAFKYKVDYLESNLMLNYYPIKDSKFYIRGGFKVGYLLRAKEDIGFGDSDIKSLFKPVRATYVIGVGYDVSEKITLNTQFSRDVFSAISTQPFFNKTIRFMIAWNLNNSN